MYSIEFVEGTTRYVNLTCKRQEDGTPFDFTGYRVQTYVRLYGRPVDTELYPPCAIIGNMVSFKIPAADSVGKCGGIMETRIFREDEVESVIIGKILIKKSPKPNVVPVEME